jgi:hypothetical protein
MPLSGEELLHGARTAPLGISVLLGASEFVRAVVQRDPA